LRAGILRCTFRGCIKSGAISLLQLWRLVLLISVPDDAFVTLRCLVLDVRVLVLVPLSVALWSRSRCRPSGFITTAVEAISESCQSVTMTFLPKSLGGKDCPARSYAAQTQAISATRSCCLADVCPAVIVAPGKESSTDQGTAVQSQAAFYPGSFPKFATRAAICT
jgi:hypothetical protein